MTLTALLLLFLALLLLLLVLVVAFLILPAYRLHRHYVAQGVSSAPFIPISGYIPLLSRYHRRDRSLSFYHDMSRRYGLVHNVSFGPNARLTVNDPRYIADVLSASHASSFEKAHFSKRVIGGMVGLHNVLLTEREEHTRHRRMLAPAFHHANLVDMVDRMVAETQRHIDTWLAPAQAKAELDLGRAMSSLTLSIINSFIFGAGFNAIPDAHSIFYTGLEQGMRITMRRLVTLVEVIPVVRSLPWFGKVQRDRTRAQMRALVDQVVQERKEGRADGLREGKADLLDLLLSAKDPDTGATFTDREVRDEAMTFVLAGHETTSNLMTFALVVLLKRPELWRDCLQEVLSVCGDDPPTHQHLSQLPTLDAVLHETLRFFSPVPIIARDVYATHTIGASTGQPIQVPKGATLQFHICVIHRLREYWGEDADAFDHTRWMRGKKPYSHPYAYLPFSLGPRGCIGSNFALLEARVMLASILQRCSMSLVEGQKVDDEGWPIVQPAITLRPKYGVQVRVAQRVMARDEAKAK